MVVVMYRQTFINFKNRKKYKNNDIIYKDIQSIVVKGI